VTEVAILNPSLREEACCLYGDWFALDLLVELWTDNAQRGLPRKLTKTCPACGARVTVDWEHETVRFSVHDYDEGTGQFPAED
jgi:hypothetical protein